MHSLIRNASRTFTLAKNVETKEQLLDSSICEMIPAFCLHVLQHAMEAVCIQELHHEAA